MTGPVTNSFLRQGLVSVSFLPAAANLLLFFSVCSTKPATILHGPALAKHARLSSLRSSSPRLCAPAPVARVPAAAPPTVLLPWAVQGYTRPPSPRWCFQASFYIVEGLRPEDHLWPIEAHEVNMKGTLSRLSTCEYDLALVEFNVLLTTLAFASLPNNLDIVPSTENPRAAHAAVFERS